MYSNNKNGFSVIDLVTKIIFAGLFIFILVWLFQKKVPNMTAFYSNVFRENIKYMQEAGESYFTDDKMPVEIGESKQITLSEMIDQKLILEFVDNDGKPCDTSASYVSVTKMESGYELKTNLVCDTESDYTVKILGCHTYCPNGNCTNTEKVCHVEKITKNQFKKLVTKTTTTYSCPSGYKKSGKKCVKTGVLVDSKSAVKETTNTKTLTMDASANVVSGTKTQVSTVKTQTSANKTGTTNTVYDTAVKTTKNDNIVYDTVVTKTTPSTTTQEAYDCTKYKTVNECKTIYETRSYSCNCTSAIDSTGKTVTRCSTCTKSVPVESCSNVTKSYIGTCYKDKTVSGTTTYSCPSTSTNHSGSGSSLKCWHYTSSTTYSCPSESTNHSGSGSSLKCWHYTTTYTYSCPSNTISSGSGSSLKCYTYSCPSNSNYSEGSGANLKCYKVTNGSVSYYCSDKSYTLSGTKCYKTVTETNTELSCAKYSGYVLEGKKCNKYKTETIAATAKKVTKKSYTYKWSTKSSISGWTKTGKTKTVNGKKVCE